MKVKKAWFLSEGGVLIKNLPEVEGKELDLKTLYPIIGCTTIEHVALKKGVDMWIDEEGLLISNPKVNPEATRLYRAAYPHIDPSELGIFGNAVVTDNTKVGNFIS